MNLKAIQTNITVCTSTEGEAKELLAILHEGGYCWTSGKSLLENNYWHYRKDDTAYLIFSDKKMIDVIIAGVFNSCMLTLAEFKRLYCDFDDTFTNDCKSTVKVEEKPQSQFQVGDKVIVVTTDYNLKDVVGGIGIITKIMPHGYHIKSSTGEWFVKDKDIMLYSVFTKENPKPQFKLGDKVKVLYSPDHQGKISVVESVIRSTTDISPYCYALSGILGTFLEKCLEPYTEPETKEKTMETKDLNLCELLKVDDKVYSPIFGESYITEMSNDRIAIRNQHCAYLSNGKYESGGEVMLYPSRTLYEQYPLDAYAAWMKWQEEQLVLNRIFIAVNDALYDPMIDAELYFRTPADRDKCIEEIKAIINKHSKEVEK